MSSKTDKKNLIKSVVLTIVGTFLYALTVRLFLEPSGLVTGGTTGIALALQRTSGIPISGSIFIMDGLLLLWGLFDLGKKFAATTVLSTLSYPISLEIIKLVLGNTILTNDMFLCTIFSGVGVGLSLGIVIHAGASTGGMDIPPLSLKKHFGLPLSLTMNILDFTVIIAQALFMPLENILYGIVMVLLYTVILDKFLLIGQSRTQITIVSEHAEEIRQSILNELDHGVTVLYGEGGYLKQPQNVLITIVQNRALPRVEATIKEIDPVSFIAVSRVNTVEGRGFSLKKKYR